jgi:hypothetical protein
MTKTVRYELRTDWTFIEKLERVSSAAGLTKAEAIGAGIDLLERLVEADKQGKEFALVSKINMANNVTRDTERLQMTQSTASELESNNKRLKLTASRLELTASRLELTASELSAAVSRTLLALSRLKKKKQPPTQSERTSFPAR